MRDGDQIRFLFPPRNSPKTTVVPADSVPALKAATEGREEMVKGADYRGVPVITAGRSIGYGGWGLVVKMDTTEAYRPILKVVQFEALAGIIVMALGLVAAYLLARRFIHPGAPAHAGGSADHRGGITKPSCRSGRRTNSAPCRPTSTR